MEPLIRCEYCELRKRAWENTHQFSVFFHLRKFKSCWQFAYWLIKLHLGTTCSYIWLYYLASENRIFFHASISSILPYTSNFFFSSGIKRSFHLAPSEQMLWEDLISTPFLCRVCHSWLYNESQISSGTKRAISYSCVSPLGLLDMLSTSCLIGESGCKTLPTRSQLYPALQVKHVKILL